MAALTTDQNSSATVGKSSPQTTFKIGLSGAQTHLGGKCTQQDCGFSLKTQFYSVLAVFDGHGNDGFSNAAMAVAKSYVSRPAFYEELKRTPQKTAGALFAAMQRSNFEFVVERLQHNGVEHEVRDGHIYCTKTVLLRGGTTATLVIIDIHGLVTTMNVGDSDAWMHSASVSTKLTAEHSVETPEEYDRLMALSLVLESPKKVHCLYDRPSMVMPMGVSDDIPADAVHGKKDHCPYYISNVDGKPATILAATDENGIVHKLAMSRALGDENVRKCGLISTPSVSQHQIREASVIKIASDGYWDAIKSSVELTKTNDAIERLGMDPNKLASDWFVKTKTVSDREFRGSGDNMWGYVAVVSLN